MVKRLRRDNRIKSYLKESVEKDFKIIPQKDVERIIPRIKTLAKDPKPSGHEKLTGQDR